MRKSPGSTPASPSQPEPEWGDLAVFAAIAETGSLTRAAERLKTTQPTVSRRLDDLEARLGVILVVRSPTGVTLTDAGRLVAGHAATMERSVKALTQTVSARDRQAAGKVAIVCPDAMATYILAPALADFQRAFPNIQLEVRDRADPHAQADITIQFRETKRMDDVAVSLGWLHYAAFVARSYLELYPAPLTMTDAFQHKLLVSLDHVEQIERWKERVKPFHDLVEPVMTTDCGTFLIRSTIAGAGISALPTYLGNYEPDLIMLDVGELARLRFWLVFDRENGERKRMREVIEWLKEAFAPARNPWFWEEFIRPTDFAPILAR